MPPREQNGLYHRAERTLRDAVITFENGSRIEVPEIRAMSVVFDDPDEMPITNIGAQEATFSLEGGDVNDKQDVIEEYIAAKRMEALESALLHIKKDTADVGAIVRSAKAFSVCSSFMDVLNYAWKFVGDDFELADEKEYAATDPISFDELMGGYNNDN